MIVSIVEWAVSHETRDWPLLLVKSGIGASLHYIDPELNINNVHLYKMCIHLYGSKDATYVPTCSE